MEKKIIVLGMHRGGTSLTANLLYSYGLCAGNERLLLKGNAENPRGYWEYTPLVEFNDELLASVEAKWSIPPSDEGYKELERNSAESKYKEKAMGLIEDMRESGRPWFWKDPRLAVLLPFWRNIWGNVDYVIPLRHPLDIALSLRKRDKYPISASLLIWQRHMLAILKETESAQCRIFIEYESLFKDPIEQCERLYLFLNQCYEPRGTRQQIIDKMARTIAPELRNNSSNSSFLNVPQATEEQKALYSYLQRKAQNVVQGSDQIDFSIYAGWREYLLTINAMSQLWFLLPQQGKQLTLSRLSVTHKEQFGL